MGCGVLMGDTLCLVGSAVAAGVSPTVGLGLGDGSAPSVVGSAVARSEDDSSVGSSEPPQARSSNGRISAKAKRPRKRRGVLISIHSLSLLGLSATTRRDRIIARAAEFPASAPGTVESMTRSVYPLGVRFDSTGANGWLVPHGSANGKKHPPGGEGLSHSPADGGVIALWK